MTLNSSEKGQDGLYEQPNLFVTGKQVMNNKWTLI